MSVDTGVRACTQVAPARARITSYSGNTDGLRFGMVYFCGGEQGFSRTFLWDRLADVVHLSKNRGVDSVPDPDPERVAAVAALLRGRP